MEYNKGIYKIEETEDNEIVKAILTAIQDIKIVKARAKGAQNGYRVYNAPCSFDIETSSFYNADNEKSVLMYSWQFCLKWVVFLGRTWEQFDNFITILCDCLNLSDELRLFCYVHNLSYEFQFIRKRLKWLKVFAPKEREVIDCLTDRGIEFKDSYILSGLSLEKVGESLLKYKVKKMVGDLDYKLVRTPLTPLTDEEVGYCVNDVLVVVAYIQEKIESDGDILKIPLTNTGYVRKSCKKECMQKENFTPYHELMKGLTLESDEYQLLKLAFSGGFTHANGGAVGEVFKNVASFDFASSYPAVMVSEQFPMTKGVEIDIQESQISQLSERLCLLMVVKITGLYSKVGYEDYLSESHCYNAKHLLINNGRIVQGDELTTVITEQDYFIMKEFYEWDTLTILTTYGYAKGYLPKAIIEQILSYYEKKTTLKGVEGKEEEYMKGKGMLNSIYGMMVTDFVRDEIIYTESDEWVKQQTNLDEEVKKYNNSKNRFLFYPWGVWVTAYARRNLFTGIKEFGDDYIYSDTDSLKVLNYKAHDSYIKEYNQQIKEKIDKCLLRYHLDPAKSAQKTITGKVKQLGVWEFEGVYGQFKTLGAKRYLYTDEKGEYHLTVAGVSKKSIKYLQETYKDKVFEIFTDDLYIPPSATGKSTHTYIDNDMKGYVTDYKGAYYEYHELSGIHLENVGFSLSLSDSFIEYLKMLSMKKVD